jgi:hypothetical protein
MWVLIGVCGLAGIITGLLALGIVPGLSRRANAYHDLPETQVHVGLLLAQVAFWFIAAPLLLVWRHQLKTRWGVQTSWWHVALAAIFLGGLIVVPVLLGRGQNTLPPGSYQHRVVLMYPLGLFVFVPALLVLDTIATACRDDKPDPTTANYVEEYFVMRSALQRVLVVMGVVVSLIVIATGAFYNALRAWNEAGHNVVVPPQSALLVYGGLFVAILIAMFLPVLTDKDLATELEKRYKMRTMLGLEENTRDMFQRSILVLSPLLSAALTTFIGT